MQVVQVKYRDVLRAWPPACFGSCFAMLCASAGPPSLTHFWFCLGRSMCACMQTQHKVQLDARDSNPSLVQPLSPYMAPIQQAMGIPVYGPPGGYPAGPGIAPQGKQAGAGDAQGQQRQYYPPPPQ